MRSLIVPNSMLPSIKEGVIKGLEIASGAKSSSTYYHKREDQIKSVQNAIANLYDISKELPILLALQNGSTGFYVQEAILNELKRTSLKGATNIVDPQDWYDDQIGNKALLKALFNMDTNAGITYVLRTFIQLKERNINNSRARKIALGYVWGHDNLEFVSIKYRNKLKVILRHIYGEKTCSALLKIAKNTISTGYVVEDVKTVSIFNEYLHKYIKEKDPVYLSKILLFIFGKGVDSYYDNEEFPVLSEYFVARTDITAVKHVPEEVLIGIIGNKRHPQHSVMWSTKEKREDTLKVIREQTIVTSANQLQRQTKKNKELGVEKVVDKTKVTDFLALYKTGYENGFDDATLAAIETLAEKRKLSNFPYNKIGIVKDESDSMKGHRTESKNTPKAVASFTELVLTKSSSNAETVKAKGMNTDLASAFIDLVEKSNEYDAIFVLSDGYENSYDGLLNEVIDGYRKLTESQIPIYHLSPVTGAEVKSKVRSIGDQVSTIAISKPETLMNQINAKLLEQDTKKWLEREFTAIENY